MLHRTPHMVPPILTCTAKLKNRLYKVDDKSSRRLQSASWTTPWRWPDPGVGTRMWSHQARDIKNYPKSHYKGSGFTLLQIRFHSGFLTSGFLYTANLLKPEAPNLLSFGAFRSRFELRGGRPRSFGSCRTSNPRAPKPLNN